MRRGCKQKTAGDVSDERNAERLERSRRVREWKMVGKESDIEMGVLRPVSGKIVKGNDDAVFHDVSL